MKIALKSLATISLAALICSCDSGSGSSQNNADRWKAGVYPDSDTYYNRCENPRTVGISPMDGQPYDEQQGRLYDEMMWLRSAMHELYLWNDEVADINPATVSELEDYFYRLLSPQDRFSYVISEEDFSNHIQSGVETGFGALWHLEEDDNENLLFFISHVDPSSDYIGSIQRGDRLVAVNGVVEGDSQFHAISINAIYYSEVGEEHQFTFIDHVSRQEKVVNVRATEVSMNPVPIHTTLQTETGNVGYMLFNSHNEVSEDYLISAVSALAQENITDLVLDLRYNGGGLLSIASELSYMIAGPVPTENEIFDKITFNDDITSSNFLGVEDTVIPFFDTDSNDEPLPTLNLDRLFVLTGAGTCSASEAIMNGLRGVDVDVIQVGYTTCGKPYGSIPIVNCGNAFSFIQFRNENAKGFGDYADGFTPTKTSSSQLGEELPGCFAIDSLNAPLGDPNEDLLSKALHYRANGVCPSTQPQVTADTIFSKPRPNMVTKQVAAPGPKQSILRLPKSSPSSAH